MIKDKLSQLGLTDNEAKTYVYLLEHYKCKAAELAKHLDVTHPAVKKILDGLVAKKLVYGQTYGKTVYYFLEGGNSLEHLVTHEMDELQEQQQRQLDIARETDNLIQGKTLLEKDAKINVQYYKGKEGLEQLAQEISATKSKKIYEFVDTDLVLYKSAQDIKQYADMYRRNGIEFETIFVSNDRSWVPAKDIIADVVRLAKDGAAAPLAHMFVFDNKVAFSFITDDKNIVVIENSWIANTLLMLFKELRKRIKTD